ncbi:MAG: sugar kinase [Pseudomonadales bacterium]
MTESKKLAAIGECMLELRQQASGQFAMGYGGDVFNVAVYAQRVGLEVNFISATGDDRYSNYLLDAWANEGVNTTTVRVLTGETPALYIIETDTNGERSFHYWRSATPFKHLLAPGEYLTSLPSVLQKQQCVYFSGISLALFSDDDKETLLKLLQEYRAGGGLVAFDPNYRPKLWQANSYPDIWLDRAYAVSNIALPSFDDEKTLRGFKSKQALIAHIRQLGASEIVVKDGASGATYIDADQVHDVAAQSVSKVVDSTAAGDSFNGAYLARRLQGVNQLEAIHAGCEMAAKVIQQPGAIIPAD